MRRKKIVIKGVSMASDEEDWNRNKRDYNLMDIQREAKVAKGAQWMDGWMDGCRCRSESCQKCTVDEYR